MIAKLKGLVDSLGDDWVVIDVSGVGYLVFCSARTLGRLSIGDAVALEIETHVREDHIHLYGFGDVSERDWFKLLTTVQGVGAKVGLGILSAISGDELTQAIAAGDKAMMTRAPGVGPKLAVRILSELKDKVATLALHQAGSTSLPGASAGATEISSDAKAVKEAASALVNLGYSPSDALGAASRAQANLGGAASVEALIPEALKELST